MKYYFVYNVVTGKIVSTGSCSDRSFALQKEVREKGDLKFMEGQVDQVRQKVVEGKVVDKTQVEIDADFLVESVVPAEKRIKYVIQEEWDMLMTRVAKLEKI